MSLLATRCFTIPRHELPRWDLKTARASRFRLAHPAYRPLGNFIEEATDLVNPRRDPDADWPVHGVNNREGVYFSHHQKGSEFNSAYKRIQKDWFVHNPTRANVGSLGRVPEVPDHAITSPEYQVWRIRDRFLPEFVEILIRTETFLELVHCHRVGAVKQRLFVQNLMEIPVPVLTEAEQRVIIKRWRKVGRKLEQIEDQRKRLVSSATKRFLTELGLTSPKARALPKAFGVPWSALDRWGVTMNMQIEAAAPTARRA